MSGADLGGLVVLHPPPRPSCQEWRHDTPTPRKAWRSRGWGGWWWWWWGGGNVRKGNGQGITKRIAEICGGEVGMACRKIRCAFIRRGRSRKTGERSCRLQECPCSPPSGGKFYRRVCVRRHFQTWHFVSSSSLVVSAVGRRQHSSKCSRSSAGGTESKMQMRTEI